MLGSGNSRNEDIVSKFFNSARAHGAESLSADDKAKLGTRDALKFASVGKGYRLGDTSNPSELIESSNAETVSISMFLW